ncbi:MAG: hypothetical protein Q7R41_11695 [Phycisphaerales bacterium]|nr:hypothetical protein [Phycisphaerales bacterium]
MTIDRLRKAVRAEPFKPFTISLTDGRRLYVRHPEFILVPPEASRTFVIAESGEDYSIIDLLLVTSIDFAGRKMPGGKNGKRNGPSRGT